MCFLATKLIELKELMIIGVAVLGILLVAREWWVSRTLSRVVGALIIAGVVIWGTQNVEWFKTQIGQETGANATVSSTLLSRC